MSSEPLRPAGRTPAPSDARLKQPVRSWAALSLLLLTTALSAAADSQRPLRSARSENGRFVLRIERGRDAAASQPADDLGESEGDVGELGPDGADALGTGDEAAGADGMDRDAGAGHAESVFDDLDGAEPDDRASDHDADDGPAAASRPAGHRGRCRATLLDRRSEQRGRAVWEAVLVNEVAPVYGAISDDGRFVVTMDEYRFGGARHALVIYGEKGRRLHEFRLRELLSRHDLDEVKVRGSSIDWLSGAKFRFREAPATFTIELRWGREIYIDLEHSELVDERGQPLVPESDEFADAEPLPAELADLLDQADGEAPTDDDGHGAELLAELVRLVQAADPSLDPAAQGELFDAVAAQAAELLAAGATGPDVEAALRETIEHALASLVSQPNPLAGVPNVGQTFAEGTGEGENAEQIDALPEEAVPLAGNSAEFGVPVPQPTLGPGKPVNYVAWMNAQRQSDPRAELLYQQAITSYVPPSDQPGDGPDLLDRALDGDPAALSDPRLAEWLASNQAALDAYRSATQYEYRGGALRSEDGSLIGALLPALAPMRQLAKANLAAGRLAASQGHFDEAANAYLDTLDAGAQTGAGTTLIEGLVGQAVQSLATDSMLDLMADDVDDTLDYSALRDELAGVASPRPITQTFQFERAMALDVVQRATDFDPDTGQARFNPTGSQALPSVLALADPSAPNEAGLAALRASSPADSLRNLTDYYDRMSSALAEPYPLARDGLSQLDQEISTRTGVGADPLVAVLAPALTRASFLYTRGETNRRATTLVSELKAYKQQFGTYPDSLPTLGTPSIIDPFTGQPFGYRRDGNSFVLYSLGGNGVDDGGTHNRRGDQGDLVIWPRPPKE